MGLTHIRTPKNFVLEERLERYGAVIEQQPERYRGRWAEACWPLGETASEAQTAAGSASTPPAATKAASGAMGAATKTGSPEQPNAFASVHLDLGCGKGSYLIARAQQEPSTLFIGMDTEPICIAYSAQYVTEAQLANAVILPRGAASAPVIFAEGELTGISLNFPTPYPKSRHAERRLSHIDHLLRYRALLAPGGTVTLRTDSAPLFEYSIPQFEAAGYQLQWTSRDVRSEHPGIPETEYERRTVGRGATIFGICATPGSMPSEERIQAARAAEQSLVAYLPEDLGSLSYVPIGMEGAVSNLRNRERKGRRRIP